ncbi:hypothetical protein ACH4VT_33660 [Streptomyces lydicus]|uniref:hypothetical protein n=1 Tax=Streptomyces lydicus TaxID=47763 RepID=UPI0037A61EBA
MKKNTTFALTAAATAAALLAGCSGNDDQDQKGDNGEAAAKQVAIRYQQAVNQQDWATACGLKTTRARHGNVTQCVQNHVVTDPAPEPSQSSTPPEDRPSYADGSSVPPMAKPTPADTSKASTSPARTGEITNVPAVGKHPAGLGIAVIYTVTHRGDDPSTERNALRLVEEQGTWHVDQSANIHDSDLGHGSTVRQILSRE